MSAFWDDVDAVQMTHSDEPTTVEERDDLLKRRGKHTGRLLYGPKTMMGRLIADVKRLEAEVKRLEVKGCPQCPHCHPDSRWP